MEWNLPKRSSEGSVMKAAHRGSLTGVSAFTYGTNAHTGKRNSIFLDELSEFESIVRETLPENIEEIDESEEHDEKHLGSNLSSPHSPYLHKKARTASNQRLDLLGKEHRTNFFICDRRRVGDDHPISSSVRRNSIEASQTSDSADDHKKVPPLLSGRTDSQSNGATLPHDPKYLLVKTADLEGLIDQCIMPHRRLDDPHLKYIVIEQYHMFTSKEKLAMQLLQSCKKLYGVNRNSNNHTQVQPNRDEDIKWNVKLFIKIWREEHSTDFQDEEAILALDSLISLCALINLTDVKNALCKQRKLLDVKVRCFERSSSSFIESEVAEKRPKESNTGLSARLSGLQGLPSKLSVPVFGLTKKTQDENSHQPTQLTGQGLDPRQIRSMMAKPKKRPLLRSWSIRDEQQHNQTVSTSQSNSRRGSAATEFKKNFCPFTPEDVAKQLTFKYYTYLMDVEPFDMVKYAQGKLSENSPIQEIINLNKRLEDWIPSSILQDIFLKSSKIGSIIEFWLKVAIELKALRNYECLQMVVHSLDSPLYDSERLPDIWSYVGKSSLQKFEELRDIVSINDNYQILRSLQQEEELTQQPDLCMNQGLAKTIKKKLSRTLSRKKEEHSEISNPGFIPCINVVKKDILGIMANYDMKNTEKEIIELAMHRKIHQRLQQIRLAQRLFTRSLPLQNNEMVWDWIRNLPFLPRAERDYNSGILKKR